MAAIDHLCSVDIQLSLTFYPNVMGYEINYIITLKISNLLVWTRIITTPENEVKNLVQENAAMNKKRPLNCPLQCNIQDLCIHRKMAQ